MRAIQHLRRAIAKHALRAAAPAAMACGHHLMRRSMAVSRHAHIAAFTSAAAPAQQFKIERSASLKEVQFKTSGATKVEVHVRPSLMEHIEVSVHGTASPDAFRVEEASASLLQIAEDDLTALAGAPVHVDLAVPMMLSLQLSLVSGDVHFHDKIEGDVRVSTGAGNIDAHKVRGMKLHLSTNDGAIRVHNLLEGDAILLSAKQIECKKIMAKFADVKITKSPVALDSSFGAMYVAQAVVGSVATGALRVGNIHGALDIKSQDATLIQVGSVNGSLAIEDVGDNCDIDVHYDSLHQVAEGEHASNLSCGGQIQLSIEPSVVAQLELHAEEIATDGCTFTEFELDQLEDDYAIATGTLAAQAAPASTSASSGKINLSGAKDSAMTTSFFSSSSDADDNEDVGEGRSHEIPTIFAHACSGKISATQLNWMEKIRRKHQTRSA